MALNLKSNRGSEGQQNSAGAGDVFGRELANWLFPLYLATILFGMLAIRSWGMPTGSVNGVRAMFIAINAATLTGFQQNPGLSALSRVGQSIVFLLIILGSLFNMIVGGLAVRRIIRSRYSDLQIIVGAVIVESAAVIFGTMMLTDTGRNGAQAILLAASSVGNCGLFLGELPNASSPMVYFAILPLSIIGGLGIPVLLELFDFFLKRLPLSKHSNSVLVMSALMFLVGFALLFALNAFTRQRTASEIGRLDMQCSVLAIQARTGGLPIVPMSKLNPSSQWIMILLMMIGASPAGTGGGLKTTTLAELWGGVRRLLSGQPVTRSLGIAVSWLAIYLAMILGAAVLLSHVDYAGGADTILFNAVSAVSNVGFSTAELPDGSRLMYAYSAIMLLGRMAPLLVLWWMADSTSNAELAIG